jgi:hypothetical protein
MHRRGIYKKSSIKERITESVISYLIMFIIIAVSFVLLNSLSIPNSKTVKTAKSDLTKVKAEIKIVKSDNKTTNKTPPKKIPVKNAEANNKTINVIPPNKIVGKNVGADTENTALKKVETNTKTIKKTIISNVIPKKMKRSEAYRRGMEIINYVWIYNADINGVESKGNVALPNYLKGVKQLKISGLPYCWGGYTSLDISDKPDVKNFGEAIKKGYTAGNVYCLGNYKNLTAGLDCSGFVCAVYKIPEKYGTDNLNNYFNIINVKDLKPMDILNCRDKHVFIYLGETTDKKGIITMEASYDKSSKNSEKTLINYRSWASITKGNDGKPYIAMRYKGIINDNVKVFRDKNEYNFGKEYTVEIKQNQQNKGYIDYADDVDYYKLNVNKATKYILQISSMPLFCRMTMTNSTGKVILNITKRGSYNIKLVKDVYSIKFQAIDFKFFSSKNYLFNFRSSNLKRSANADPVVFNNFFKKGYST